MVRTLLIVTILLAPSGCPRQSEADITTAQQLAQRTAELERAKDSKSFWQNTAVILGSLSIVALVVGIVLGSSAKKHADEP